MPRSCRKSAERIECDVWKPAGGSWSIFTVGQWISTPTLELSRVWAAERPQAPEAGGNRMLAVGHFHRADCRCMGGTPAGVASHRGVG
jgi:hypothetical protein